MVTLTEVQYKDLIKDKMRLDYLDECRIRLNQYTQSKYRWKLIQNHLVNRLMCGDLHIDLQDAEVNGHESCREAIDEKMKSLGENMDCECTTWARTEPPIFSKHHPNCQKFKNPDIKIFQLNECDWWADYSLEEAIKNYLNETGVPHDEGIENPYELSDEEMKILMHSGEDGMGPHMSFIDRLFLDIENGARFPCLFASTEY